MLLNIIHRRNLRVFTLFKNQTNLERSFSDEKKKDDKPPMPESDNKPAVNRLNELLASMSKKDAPALKTKVDLTKIGVAGKKKKLRKDDSSDDDEKPKNVVEAAMKLANKMSNKIEDQKQTEAELLSKLLSHSEEISEMSVNQKSSMNLNDLIVGMKIDREKEIISKGGGGQLNRAQFVKQSIGNREAQQFSGNDRKRDFQRRPQPERTYTPSTGSVHLFSAEPLNIFAKVENSAVMDISDPLTTWSRLEKRELKLAVTHPPANYFEKMMLWTDQEKLWKFPIDNEQGMEDEKLVDFSEHIFLEQHLEGWCPNRGPVRHFMELVCVGLSKNPYITIQDKQEHINWYKDYFAQKKTLLDDLINVDQVQKSENKELEN